MKYHFTSKSNKQSSLPLKQWLNKIAGLIFLQFIFITATASAAIPGLPFIEDFSNNALQDITNSTANWSTEEQAVVLAWRSQNITSSISTTIGSEIDDTRHIVLGDVDGDGDLDVVAGNYDQTNKLYLNYGDNGFVSSFSESGTAIGSETDSTLSLALGDVDNDGDLD